MLTIALFSMVAGLFQAIPQAARAATIQTIYMSPSGSDTRDGTSPSQAVATLQRVQQLVKTPPAGFTTDLPVEVRIAGGVYESSPIIWTTYRPGRTISFMPVDYVQGQGISSVSSMPVFTNVRASGSGRYLTGSWFTGCLPASGPLSSGGASGLRFYYLKVQNYANAAISLNGSGGCTGTYKPTSGLGQPSARGLDGTVISGMQFTRIGNLYTGGTCSSTDFKRCGYGAIVLHESSYNTITNSHFIDLRNSEKSYIHAVYITHKSSHNTITSNNITGVSSGPIKVRDASNYNTIANNRFGANDFVRTSVPGPSHYLEEVGAGECSSVHNRFANNDLGTLLYGSGKLTTWVLSPGGATWAGSAGCPALPRGEVRLITAGNAY